MTTKKQAQETKISVIENGKVVQTTLYEHIMKSAERVTSPGGIEPRLHIREAGNAFAVHLWDHRENGTQFIESFHTREEAEEFIFQKIWIYDFLEDDQRDIRYLEHGKKVFYRMDNIGKAKYTINFHDGVQMHKDGSPFFGIAIFHNKVKMEKFIKKLIKEGYTEE